MQFEWSLECSHTNTQGYFANDDKGCHEKLMVDPFGCDVSIPLLTIPTYPLREIG